MTKETIKLNQELVDQIHNLTDEFPINEQAFVELKLTRFTYLILAQVDQLIEERMQGHLQASHNSAKNENQE